MQHDKMTALKLGVEQRLGCRATLRPQPHVVRSKGEPLTAVYVFDLPEHPSATIAYAWYWKKADSEQEHLEVRIHHGDADSPAKAVEAATSEWMKAQGTADELD